MTNEQKASYVNAQVACALLRMEGMKAANASRERHGDEPAYTETDFTNVILEEGIHHNAVIGLLNGY